MNKKKLSVVMAGAMLATSVAPVLAAEVTAEEVKMSEKSLLQKKVLDLVKSELISSNEIIGGTIGNGTDTTFVTAEVAKIMKDARDAEVADSALSAYGIKVLDKDGEEVKLDTVGGTTNGNITYDVKEISDILATTNDDLAKDHTVQVVKRETSKFLGQVIPGTEIKVTGGTSKYTVDDFKDIATINGSDATAFIKDKKANKTNTAATITLNAITNLGDETEENAKIELTLDTDKLNFKLPIDEKGNLTDKVQDCRGFAPIATYQKSSEITAAPKVKSAYKIVDDSKKAEEVTYLANELYDGLALTAKGTEIKADIENAKKVADENNRPTKPTVILMTKESANGVHSFKVAYLDSYKDVPSDPTGSDKEQTLKAASKIVTVKTTNEKELNALIDMLGNGKGYKVGIVAGANRYETAVNVAKNKSLPKVTDANADDADKNNIVLVNGESVVDGLAAAPLAAKLNMNNAKGTAVLLSKTDSLPTATKEYLEELTSDIVVSKRKFVRINLVGGESVLSDSLVEELKEMGFSVERFGGENREETSLEVARAVVAAGDANNAFVVGANGEADAMSIASEASKSATQTPIIVAKAGGLTKNAVRFIKTSATNGDVDVIGGESVVSKAEYDKIDEVVAGKVDRVAGSNRFETNAAIIKKYASNISEVVLVKDGVANKKDLVDALSAANYAAGAPIVLATDKITESQKVAILDGKATGGFTKLTQVGQGVARTTLETVAEFLGLSNVK
ncbi:cell wall-binding repeat-containing protein [Peptacetobacter hiranonis]|uniref:cell wall-binding repeat-containing protein n=1 Tax=Peptacetobacter hiranonis TaxID=89152 RepID=UPI0022E597F7|nr:cell wall-binding repeat-containing protein [Peptacetobacter hiranonis]